MAAGSNEEYVTYLLDKEFGGNLDMLKNVSAILQQQERLGIELEKRIEKCTENTSTELVDSKKDATIILNRIESLNDEKDILKEQEAIYSEKQKDLFLTFEELQKQIEEINCLQVYLSWIFQICHLSKELSSELEKGNMAIAVEFCVSLAEIAERLSKSSCQNLVDYAVFTSSHWMKVMSDILSRNMEILLNEMKWPFPTGISSPALNDNNQELMSQFEASATLFIKLHEKNCEKGVKRAENITQLTSVLVKPLQKRFVYHFYGPRKTNNIEKPEWYFTQVLNWIRDHSLFLENCVQPLVDKAGFSHCYVQREFIKALMDTCTEKIKSSLPQISANETLFSHLIDEVLSFDTEVKSLYRYPSTLPGCISALMAKPYLDQWLQLERKGALKIMDYLLAQEQALNAEYSDVESVDDIKPPVCVESFMLHISIITERYKNLDDPEIQLQFVELQKFLLEIFISRLKEIAKEAGVPDNNNIYFSLLNGSQYMCDLLCEWSEEIFYIQLQCAKFQLSSKSTFSFANLEDSINEEIIDTSIDSAVNRSDSLVDKTLFEDILASLESFISNVMESLLKRIETRLEPLVLQYKALSWHSLPSSKEVVTPILSNGACQMLMFIKEILQSTRNELYYSIFTKFWQKFAKAIDAMIFNKVILESHFNEGGATQMKFDLMNNLLLLFQGCSQKPESYFKLIKESCCLLTLLPGSSVLLKELLNSASESDAVNALLDIGIKNISIPLACRILSSRIGQPNI